MDNSIDPIFINKAAFVDNIKNKVDGIYIFEMIGCGPCSKYSTLLKTVKTKKKVFKVDCSENLTYFISLGMGQMPETRVYEKGETVLRVQGVPKKDMLGKIFGEIT